jgi:hypothetical protein
VVAVLIYPKPAVVWPAAFLVCVASASVDNAHRQLQRNHSLSSSLSYVEARQVDDDYTIRFDTRTYQIARTDVRAGLRGGEVRVEVRLDGSLAVHFRDRYVTVTECQARPKVQVPRARPKPVRSRPKSQWMNGFHLTWPEKAALSALPQSFLEPGAKTIR